MNFEKHDSRFDALMEQWRYFNGFIDKIEMSYYSIPLVVVTIVVAGQVYINNVSGVDAAVLACFTLAACATMMVYLTFQITRVAIIRGYLLRIEDKLNELQDECDFQWHVECAQKYLMHNPFNWMMTAALLLALATVCIPAGMDVISGCRENPIFIIPLVFCVIVVVFSIYTLRYNYEILDIVREGRTSYFFDWQIAKQIAIYPLKRFIASLKTSLKSK